LQLTEQGQITERFTRAIEQLGATDDHGNPRIEIRLGGIYALERIARDSPARDYITVMEVLTAYVRENAPWPPKSSNERDSIKPPEGRSVSATDPEKDNARGIGARYSRYRVEPTTGTPRSDIQAVLEVLKRREEDRVPEKHRVVLDLWGTDLRGARLYKADLSGWLLVEANLRGADLRGADLGGANLEGANLGEASFQGAELEGALLPGANLKGAKYLTQEQIEWTIGGTVAQFHTELPDDLTPPSCGAKVSRSNGRSSKNASADNNSRTATAFGTGPGTSENSVWAKFSQPHQPGPEILASEGAKNTGGYYQGLMYAGL
jgi:hypothetical protein